MLGQLANSLEKRRLNPTSCYNKTIKTVGRNTDDYLLEHIFELGKNFLSMKPKE